MHNEPNTILSKICILLHYSDGQKKEKQPDFGRFSH